MTDGKVDKNSAERKKISFYGTKEYRLKLKRAALDRGYTGEGGVQALLEDAVEAFLASGKDPIANQSKINENIKRFPLAQEKWHELLREILQSGVEKAAQVVKNNLEVFAEYVRAKTLSYGEAAADTSKGDHTARTEGNRGDEKPHKRSSKVVSG